MKTRLPALSLISILLLALLVGCSAAATEADMKAADAALPAQTEMAQVKTLDLAVAEPPAAEPAATEPPATQPPTEKLTADSAKAIALADSGFFADQVSWLRSEYEIDDGIPEYEVEFRQGDTEYDYTIHAETGEILRRDKDYEPVKKETEPAPTEAPAAKPAEEKKSTETKESTDKISAEKAKSIALSHAGFTADQVKGLRAEYDVDDGVPEYDVEFSRDGWEYDYEIHAETGKIRSWDKDD